MPGISLFVLLKLFIAARNKFGMRHVAGKLCLLPRRFDVSSTSQAPLIPPLLPVVVLTSGLIWCACDFLRHARSNRVTVRPPPPPPAAPLKNAEKTKLDRV